MPKINLKKRELNSVKLKYLNIKSIREWLKENTKQINGMK